MAWDGYAKDIPDKLRRDLLTANINGWKWWVPGEFINFRFVPLGYRVLWANGLAAVWNVYLSFISHT